MAFFEGALIPALDANGNPINGARWKFYLSGTTTPLAVYSDSNLTNSLGVQVTADSAGRYVPVYYNGATSTRARMETAAGALIGNYDVDPINPRADVSGFTIPDLQRLTRLRTLSRLQSSMARTGGKFASVMAVPPTIGAGTAATGIVTGTTWQIYSDAGVPQHTDKFTMLGGVWGGVGPTNPNNYTLRARHSYQGNGTDPLTNPNYGGIIRFSIEAPEVELWVQTSTAASGDGIRVKVNGEYIKTGVIANEGNGLYRYIKLTWPGRAVRNYEMEFGSTSSIVGIRAPIEYKPSPWPQADGVRALIHGDSLIWTIVDSIDRDTGRSGALGVSLRNLIGQADTIASGTGGAGWMAPVPKTISYFNDRVATDVVARAPDVIIETGGGNDASVTPTQSAHQTLVEAWLSAVITANPNVIIFMTGPVIASAAGASHLTIQASKQAAAALYPRNVRFIDTLTDPLVFGTGRQGATTGNGNRDWVTGSDGAHPTMDGHSYLAARIYAGVAAAIPGLIAANQT